MRIRKNTTLSSLLLAAGCGGERPQTHVCHLNQSPWDVIPFSSSADGAAAAALTNQLDTSWFLPSSSSSSPRIHQFDEDDSFNGNVSLGDSTGAAESVVSVERLDIIAEDNNEKSPDEEHTDRSGWRSSGSKGKKSKSHVEPNSSQRTSGQATPASGATNSPPRRGRPRGTGKKASATASNPYEFYYYSGFGPRWGKRRGGGGKNGAEEEETIISNGNGDSSNIENNNVNKMKSVSGEEDKTAAFGGERLDEMEGEEEDDVMDPDTDVGRMMMKKRARKPVKARSLKSLM